jgi:hypothetical protein
MKFLLTFCYVAAVHAPTAQYPRNIGSLDVT